MRRRGRLVAAIFALLLFAALAARVFDLDAFVNIDAVSRWHGRTLKFWQAAGRGAWRGTFQLHPGVTLMWLSGASMKLFGAFSRTFSPETLRAATLPVAIVGALVAPLTFLLLRKLLGPRRTVEAALAGALIATEPFLVAHSRTMHLDMLVTAFAWLAALAGAITVRRGTRGAAIAAGALLGLAVLSKLSGSAVAVGVALWIGVAAITRARSSPRGALRLAALLAVVTLVAVSTAALLWPSLLFHPSRTIARLLEKVPGVIDRGHSGFAWGRVYAKDAGAALYGATLAFRTSPEVLLPAIVALPLFLFARGTPAFALRGLLLCYAPLLFAALHGTKKLDRYMLPFYPLLCAAAAFTLAAAWRLARRKLPPGRAALASAITVATFGLGGRAARLAMVHPLTLAWCAPVPGWRCEEGILLGWGEGMKEVARWIARDGLSEPGRTPKVWGGLYTVTLTPWLRFHRARSQEADYVVRYISEAQRKRQVRQFRRSIGGRAPRHEVRIEGRVYAAIYDGPVRAAALERKQRGAAERSQDRAAKLRKRR